MRIKLLTTIILLLLLSISSKAQYNIVCDFQKRCKINQFTHEYEDDCHWDYTKTAFVFSNDYSTITIVTKNTKSIYHYVSDYYSVENDKGEPVYIMTMESESGHRYIFMLCVDGAYINWQGEYYKSTYHIDKIYEN